MTSHRLSPEAAAARTADRIECAQQRIAEAVAAIQSGAEWRDYLLLQSRLHAYSGPNTLMIWSQYAELYAQGLVATPWPTYVAGFHTWKVLGRFVEKGQHGLEILAPNRHTARVALDPRGHERTLARGEQPEPGEQLETRQAIAGFRIEHVFSQEQTSGGPLPAPPTPQLLRGHAPTGLWDTVAAQIQDHGFQLQMVPTADELGGVNGLTNWDRKTVQIRADMDESARARTAIHELAHCIMHEPATLEETHPGRPRPSRGALEVEAESVAFVVSDAHHLAADDYSFPYVAAWAGPDGVDVVQASVQRVATAARQIIANSTCEHSTGGRVPGAEQAIAARQHRAKERQPYAEPAPHEATATFEVAG